MSASKASWDLAEIPSQVRKTSMVSTFPSSGAPGAWHPCPAGVTHSSVGLLGLQGGEDVGFPLLSEKCLIIFCSVGRLLGALWKETKRLFLPLLWFKSQAREGQSLKEDVCNPWPGWGKDSPGALL